VRFNYEIASILLFMIDNLFSSKSIQSGTKISKVKLDDKIKLWEILRPLHLFVDQYFGSRKVLIIHNNINKKN